MECILANLGKHKTNISVSISVDFGTTLVPLQVPSVERRPTPMAIFGITPEAAWIAISCSTGLIWSTQVLFIRIFLRCKVNGPWGLDDSACALATVSLCLSAGYNLQGDLLGLAQSSLVLLEIRYGLGFHLSTVTRHDTDVLRFLVWLASSLWILAIAFSMLSTCLLIVRIVRIRQKCVFAYGAIIAITLWASGFILVTLFRCPLPYPWKTNPTRGCLNQYTIWLAFNISQAILEGWTVFLSVLTVWGLQMHRNPKILVALAFSVRILTIPPASVRLQYIYDGIYSADWSFARVNVSIIAQIQMHMSIMLATVPCVKPWLTVFEGGGLLMHMTQDSVLAIPLTGSSRSPQPPETPPVRPPIIHKPYSDRHRLSVDRWQAHLSKKRLDQSRTITKIEHNPEHALVAARRRSIESSDHSKNGIMRTDSFSIAFDTIGDDGTTKSRSSPGSQSSAPREAEEEAKEA